tara:strand:+ start:66 stop:674 length:609 start_codon:yes stop_codon:yes gene_type:complete
MPKYATGKYAKAISDRSGMEFPHREMVREWNGAFVHVSEFEPKQPQLEPKPLGADGVSLRNVRTDRTEPATTVRIIDNGFETYAAGSGIINVSSPGHGLTDNTTYRFRGPPTTSAGSAFTYSNPESFDGITGSNIAKAAGYTIRTGKYKSDSDGAGTAGRDARSAYLTDNFFFFTVDTNTATTGSIKGGGYGCSVGPVTIEA